MSSKPVTIKDVAREAGVSFTHVSRAFRNPAKVLPATLERIQHAAAALQYQPNIAAAMLATRKSGAQVRMQAGSLAYVHEHPEHAFTGAYGRAVRERAGQLGYGFELVNLRSRSKVLGVTRELRARGVLGVVFGPRALVLSSAPSWNHFSLVSCEMPKGEPPASPVVQTDKFRAVQLAVDQAVAAGYRRIGFSAVAHGPAFIDDLHRAGAWILCQQQRRVPGLKLLDPYVQETTRRDAAGFLRWMRRIRPDVLIGFTALELWWLREAGYSIPGDCGFIALCLIDADPVVTGCVEDLPLIAHRAVDLCDQYVRLGTAGWQEEPAVLVLPPKWNPGSTLK